MKSNEPWACSSECHNEGRRQYEESRNVAMERVRKI